ncbi:MAG TPA: hypothetical protein VFK50_08845 [Sphingomicrobium sp.]|nr:hypothetical protein [Sphingomicrobium sp.]
MSSAPPVSEIAAGPAWLAQAMDAASGNVRFVRMTPDDYRNASFLDDRIFQVAREHHILPWEAATAALPADARADARWIFHIGHVGSTLISRLVGEFPRVLSLREPRILRDLAGASAAIDRYIPGLRKLVSRTFAPGDIAVVKATSFASELAGALVPEDGLALFVHASPQAYFGTCLAGENTMREVAALAPARRDRMKGRVSLDGITDRSAHLVAAAWACEMTALELAATSLPPGAVHWLDFDQFLADVPGELSRVAAFLGLDAPAGQIAEIADGPLLGRYSKALEYDYSPDLRRQLIDAASAEHAGDIDRALAMLSAAAQESPLLARALDRSTGEG